MTTQRASVLRPLATQAYDNIIPLYYVGALPESRERLIQMNGKLCSAWAELTLTKGAMMELSTKANTYLHRMDSALHKRDEELVKNGGNYRDGWVMLLDAEWAFAEDCFLHLSAQATVFQHRIRSIEATLSLLSVQNAQLYAQIDGEMNDGMVAKDIPLGEWLHYRRWHGFEM